MKVKLIEHNSDEQMRWGGCADTRKHLLGGVGEVYEVKRKDVHSWHCKLILEGFDNQGFNSVCFEQLEPTVNS